MVYIYIKITPTRIQQQLRVVIPRCEGIQLRIAYSVAYICYNNATGGHRKERGQLASERGDYVITFTVKSVLYNVNCRSASTYLTGWQIIQA